MKKTLLLTATAILLVGCATLTSNKYVPINLSITGGQAGNCTLTNKFGEWQATAPAEVWVRRSSEDLAYNCVLADGSRLTGIIPTVGNPRIAGNLVVGGIVGAGVDAVTEKSFNYPAEFIIGESSEETVEPESN